MPDERIEAIRAATILELTEFREHFWPLYQREGFDFPTAFFAHRMLLVQHIEVVPPDDEPDDGPPAWL